MGSHAAWHLSLHSRHLYFVASYCKNNCCRLTVCNPQNSLVEAIVRGFWRWSPWEVIRLWGWRPHDGISIFIRRGRELAFSLSMGGYNDKMAFCKTRGPWQRTRMCWHCDFRLLASRTVGNECLLFKPPSLWYFILLAQTVVFLWQTCPVFEETNWTVWFPLDMHVYAVLRSVYV